MKTGMPEIGQTFEMTLDGFKGYQITFKVLDTNVKDDCMGTIRLQKIVESQKSEIHNGYASYKEFNGTDEPEAFSIVEEAWFTENNKRKIKVISL